MRTRPLQRLGFSLALTAASRLLLYQRRHLQPAAGSPLPTHDFLPSGGGKIVVSHLIVPDRPAPALLIFHGIGETVDTWAPVQRLLFRHGISSLVFDYAGYGRSSGPIRLSRFPQDAAAARTHLGDLLPAGSPISYLGLSLGTGVAVQLAQKTPPDRLILCAPYTSFREASARTAQLARLPAGTSRLLPDIWNNLDALPRLTAPTLLVHGEADELFPVQMSETLLGACVDGRLIRVPGLPHDCGLECPKSAYWDPILNFVLARNLTA